MPLPGGASAKSGLRYELLWTVRSFLCILASEAESIHLEPAGDAGKGIEFCLRTADGIEYHQVKRQQTGKGWWSLADLNEVLSHFRQRLTNPVATCVFVSIHAAHSLEELADRARNTASWEEFQSAYISFDNWSRYFHDLHERWQASSEKDTYQYLKRIRVRMVDEVSLREWVQSRLDVLVDGHPATVSDVLSQWALTQVHQQLTVSDIREHLLARGFNERRWAQDPTVLEALSEQNQRYKAGVQPVGIGGEIISRREVKQILDRFDTEEEGNIVLVSGKAGIGKSSALVQVLTEIQGRDWPWLAFRLDRLQPCLSPREVGTQLGLPGSPVSVLASVADDQDCLLVIDQLDAISLASGRHVDLFDCIRIMLGQAQHHAGMRVLLACRKFDIENDYRLREFISDQGMAQEIPVEPFDAATVGHLTTQLGLKVSEFSTRQLDLLSLPVHLRLLADTLLNSSTDAMYFQTARDLYEGFWRYKKQILHAKDTHAQNVVDRILQYMNEQETLFVPEAVLDGLDHEVSILLSENILVRDDSRISFFHESFFDFLFARQTMVSNDFDLVKYIIDRGQSLFLRSQIRHCLLYQRDISPLKAQISIQAVLAREDIRFHLKEAVLSLMGSLDDPKLAEWHILETLLDSDVAGHVWGALWGSRPWFDRLYTMEVLHEWLASDDDARIDKAMDLFKSVYKDRSDQISTLLNPFIGRSEAWNERLQDIIIWSSGLRTGKDFFGLIRKAIEVGILDADLAFVDGHSHAWHLIEAVGKWKPEWACELIAIYCARLLILAQQAGETHPFQAVDPYYRLRSNNRDVALDAALHAPRKFVKWVLPFVTYSIELNANRIGDPPWTNSIWKNLCIENKYGLANHILSAMATALGKLAECKPSAFQQYAEKLRESPYLTLQGLLLYAYGANGPRFADEAIKYLLENSAQLATWHEHHMAWVTRRLVGAVAPYCTSNHLARLEQDILEFYPEPLRRYPGDSNIHGLSQLKLLVCIPTARLSNQALTRLRELQRKFGEISESRPVVRNAFWVGSPISESKARKMQDSHWLRAMQKYSSNQSSVDHGGKIVGGAFELSRVLETLTREAPARFAALAHRIPDDADSAYLEAILSGICGSGLDATSMVNLCRYIHAWPDRPYGRQITRLLADAVNRSHASVSLSEEALDMVAWYATQAPYDASYRGEDLLTEGINTTRGVAAADMAVLIFQDASTLLFFEHYLPSMVADPSMAVRACVVQTLLGILRHNRDLAVQLFVTLCQDAAPGLLEAPSIERFLGYALQTHFTPLAPILESMIEADREAINRVGVRLACSASLTLEAAYDLVRCCVSGNKALRLGVAESYAAQFGQSAYRSKCATILGQLFSDPDEQIRNVAAGCFNRLKGRQLREYQELAQAYLISPAFGIKHNPLVKALYDSTVPMPGLVLDTCKRFFDLYSASVESVQYSDCSKLAVGLIVRVYSQTDDPQVKGQCLDVIDTISRLRVWGLDVIQQEFDR